MRIFLLLIATLLMNSAHGSNIVKNGDFSKGLTYWNNIGGAVLSTTVKAGDKNSACVTRGKYLVQKVALEPNAVYELSFLVKGENIPGVSSSSQGGRVILHGGKNYGRATTNADGSCMTGTFDWKRGIYRFNSSKFNSKRLDIYLRLDADGKLYYADVKLVKVGTEKIEVSKPGNKFFRESYLKDYPLPDFYPIDKAYGMVEPGKMAEFKLEMQLLADLEYTLTVKNELGKTVYTQKRKPYKEGEKITVPGQERGYYILEANAFVKDKKIAMVQSAFVSTPAMQGKRDPFFRVNQFCIWSPLIEGYRMIGAGSATLPVIAGEKGDPATNARRRFLGTYKAFLEAKDFELHALYASGVSLNGCDTEAFRRGYPMYSKEYLQSVETAVTEAAKILKGRVSSYGSIMEIPSQAQMKHKYAGTWVEAMSQQLFRSRIVSRAARKIDPGAKISAGGNNVQMYIEPIERLVMSDLVDDFDVYNIDAYFGSWDLTHGKPNIPERSLRDFYIKSSELARSLGKTPMVENTETGYMTYYGDRFDEGLAVTQAFLTARAMVISKASPVSSVAIFRLSTHYGFNENNPMSGSFPTVWKPGRAADNRTLTFTPLPGGAAYATFARELAFAEFVKELKTADKLLYAYVFKRPDGKTMLSAWSVENDYTLNMQLEKPALMVSMYGRETRLAAGKQPLKLTIQPFYLVLDEPAEKVTAQLEGIFKAIRPLYKSAAKLTSPDQAVLYVNNSGNEKVTVKCGAQSIDILPGSIGSTDVKVQKNQKSIAFTVNGEKFDAAIIGNTVKFKKHNGLVKLDKNGNFPAGKASGKLVVPTHVQPVSALHPELSYFKNPLNPDGHDISAEYSLTYDSKNIYMTVKVDDPTHIQRFSRESIWQGDSVQFVFANTPGAPESVRNLGEKSNSQGHNYSAALTPRGPEVVKYFTKQAISTKANVYRQNNHTVYEITVPQSEIGYVPGKPLYFDFVVFDNNSKSANMPPYWLDMDKGLAGERDNALLPLVIFE